MPVIQHFRAALGPAAAGVGRVPGGTDTPSAHGHESDPFIAGTQVRLSPPRARQEQWHRMSPH